MTLSTKEAIVRFDQNEERINKFVNEYGTYVTNSGLPNVETLPSFMQRNSEALNLLTATNVKGDWASSTAYSVWDEVKYSGTWYRCVVAHTSTGTFDSSKFRISQGIAVGELASQSGSSMSGFIQNVSSAVPRTVQDKLREWLSVKDFGAVGNGVTDDRLKLITAMNAAASAGKTLYVDDGVYICSNWIPIPSGLKMIFSSNAIWKLSSNTSLGGFVCGGYDINMTITSFENVDIYGMNIDCNSLAGENGINAVSANGVRFYNPKVINTKFSSITQGGKAFQFEGGTCDGIHVYQPYIENCSIGINSHADPAGGAEKVRHVSYYDVVMRNVDVPFNVDGQFATPENGIPDNMSTFVDGVNLYNCGKLTFSGATSTGGGIICGDRGFGLKISGLRLVNSSTYGGIGGLVRGTLFNLNISDVEIAAPSLTSVFNFQPVEYGVPSSSAHPCTIRASNITVSANLDYIVKGYYGGKVGKCLFDNIVIDSSVATLAGICDSQATTNGLGVIDVVLSDMNYKRTGRQSLLKLYQAGNSVSSCLTEYEEGTWTPVDASGAGLSLTLPDTCWYVRQGRIVTAIARIVYPTTANTANVTLGGLPYTSAGFSANAGSGTIGYCSETTAANAYVIGSTNTALLTSSAGVPIQNVAMSGDTLYISFTYFAIA